MARASPFDRKRGRGERMKPKQQHLEWLLWLFFLSLRSPPRQSLALLSSHILAFTQRQVSLYIKKAASKPWREFLCWWANSFRHSKAIFFNKNLLECYAKASKRGWMPPRSSSPDVVRSPLSRSAHPAKWQFYDATSSWASIKKAPETRASWLCESWAAHVSPLIEI